MALATLIGPGFGPAASAPAPRPAFQFDEHPPAPDYSDPDAWAALPGRSNRADAWPGGGVTSASATAPIDVFYIHPTTLRSPAHWNQDTRDADDNAWTDVSVLARQASIFNACCRIYAPRYRQAGTGSLGTADGDRAYALAYQDVRRAFLYYVAHFNKQRPFMLAGHSQGALHIYRLVAEEIAGTSLERRFVAAYAPGLPASLALFDAGRSVRPCLKPLQTGCIATWNTFLASADPTAWASRPKQPYVARYVGSGGAVFCINPLTFDVDRPSAPAASNGGSLPWPPRPGPLRPLNLGAVGVSCEGGVARATLAPGSDFGLAPLPGGSLHYQDMDLFYTSIRQNAVARSTAFLARAPESRASRAAP